jgi:hypothetical protein
VYASKLCEVTFSSFSSSFSSPFFPLPIILTFLVALLFAVAEFYFLNCGSELLLPNVDDASLFFFGVVIRFSFDDVLSLSVA